jgi:WD40 repeat protein
LDTNLCANAVLAHQMATWQIACSAQGDLLASCGLDGVVNLWSIADDFTLKEQPRLIQKSSGPIFANAFHPNTAMLATGGFEAIHLWNYHTGQLLHKFNQSELGDVAFHPIGHLLAGASHHPDIKIWDVKTGECYQTLQGHTSENWTVAFHPKGDLIASGGEDSSVRLWNIHSGECCYVLSDHTAAICCVAFSPDGIYLASASKDYTIRIWEVSTGRCIRTLTNHTNLVNFVVFHPDEQRLLLASCSHDETIRLWDTDFWICIKTLRPQRIYEDMNITEATGLGASQLSILESLGAIIQ